VDHREHAATFEVIDADLMQHGMLYLPMRWEAETPAGRIVSAE